MMANGSKVTLCGGISNVRGVRGVAGAGAVNGSGMQWKQVRRGVGRGWRL